MTVRFTPNDYVCVKLTEVGKRRALEQTDQLNEQMRARGSTMRFQVPFDDNGIMREQFWSVMRHIGGYNQSAGMDNIFEWLEVE